MGRTPHAVHLLHFHVEDEADDLIESSKAELATVDAALEGKDRPRVAQVFVEGTTLTEERLASTDAGDHDRFAHYVQKDKIVESAVMGSHVVALCGEVFPVTKSAKPGSPVCPDCKRIYESLKRG